MPTPVTEQDRLLSIDDIALVTGTTYRMARRLVEERRVPTVKVGRYVRVRQSDLDAYLEAQTRPANGQPAR